MTLLVRSTLAIVSGLLLAVPFVAPGAYLVHWFAFIPLLAALHKQSLLRSYGLGMLAGIALFLLATPWMVTFVQLLKGYGTVPSALISLAYWLYSAQMVAVMALLLCWLRRRYAREPWWLFAAIVTLVFGFFPHLFQLHPAEAQSRFLPALQGVSVTGVYGLDFVIALANALLFRLLVIKRGYLEGYLGSDRTTASEDSTRSSGRAPALAALGVLTLWFCFGVITLIRSELQVPDGPELNIGIVQPNEVPSATVPGPATGFSRAYPPEMAATERLAAAGADLVVWPETRFKGYFHEAHVAAAYQQSLAPLGTPLIFHDAERVQTEARAREYNAAVYLNAEGVLEKTYRKNRLVAFGEYLPLGEVFPRLAPWLRRHLGDFFADLTPGREPGEFRIGDAGIVPVICYESAFAGYVANAVASAAQPSLIVVISNNGWFGDSWQPMQHAGITALRAVENRMPVLHVINNGPSTLVMPNGRMTFLTGQGEAAAMVVRVPYAAAFEPTLFTRWPYWFPGGLMLLLLASLLRELLRPDAR